MGIGPAFTLLSLSLAQQALIPVTIVILAVFATSLLAWLTGAITRWGHRRRGLPGTGFPWPARFVRLGGLAAATALVGWLALPTVAL